MPPPLQHLGYYFGLLVNTAYTVDILAPCAMDGKVGLSGGAGVGKTIVIMELLHDITL